MFFHRWRSPRQECKGPFLPLSTDPAENSALHRRVIPATAPPLLLFDQHCDGPIEVALFGPLGIPFLPGILSFFPARLNLDPFPFSEKNIRPPVSPVTSGRSPSSSFRLFSSPLALHYVPQGVLMFYTLSQKWSLPPPQKK